MTCVVAVGGRRGFLCADRRIVSDTGERCAPARKVWRNEALIVAGAGHWGKLHRVMRAVERGCADPAELVELVGDDTHVLCLTPAGRLYEVTEGAVYPQRGRSAALRCIGTGGDIARGFLEGRPATEAWAGRAQALAAQLRTDCGSGWDLERWR